MLDGLMFLFSHYMEKHEQCTLSIFRSSGNLPTIKKGNHNHTVLSNHHSAFVFFHFFLLLKNILSYTVFFYYSFFSVFPQFLFTSFTQNPLSFCLSLKSVYSYFLRQENQSNYKIKCSEMKQNLSHQGLTKQRKRRKSPERSHRNMKLLIHSSRSPIKILKGKL
jgi:hypothetical protein